MIYETKKCSKCGNTLKYWGSKTTRLYYANPLTQCPKCKSWLIDGSKTEYIMHSKIGIAFRLIWDTILFGFFIGLFVVGLFMLINEDLGLGGIKAGFLISTIGLGIYFYSNFANEKAHSIARLKDINYLNQLLNAKLISQKKYDDFIKKYYKDNTNNVSKKDMENLTKEDIEYINQMIGKSNGIIEFSDAKKIMPILHMYLTAGKTKTLEHFGILADNLLKEGNPVKSLSKITFFLGVLNSNKIISEEEMKEISKTYQNNVLNLMTK